VAHWTSLLKQVSNQVRPWETKVKMLHLENYRFFNTLREKLNWATPRER
jgi:NAD kinase